MRLLLIQDLDRGDRSSSPVSGNGLIVPTTLSEERKLITSIVREDEVGRRKIGDAKEVVLDGVEFAPGERVLGNARPGQYVPRSRDPLVLICEGPVEFGAQRVEGLGGAEGRERIRQSDGFA